MGAMPPSWFFFWGGGKGGKERRKKRENHLPNKVYTAWWSRMEKEERKFFREVEKEKKGRKVWKVRERKLCEEIFPVNL